MRDWEKKARMNRKLPGSQVPAYGGGLRAGLGDARADARSRGREASSEQKCVNGGMPARTKTGVLRPSM
jgi:hypothetical protein